MRRADCSRMSVNLEAPPSPGASHDLLLGGRIRLRQPTHGYRVAVDPILLAAAVPAEPRDHVVDLGTGTGAAALCLAARVPGCRITGIEIQPRLTALARENAALNRLADRVAIVEGDIAGYTCGHEDSADHVMANPPHLTQARAAADRRWDVATVEAGAAFSAWMETAFRLVRPKGSVTVIHRADRIDEIVAVLRSLARDIIVYPLWPKRGVAAKRILVRARKRVRSPSRLGAGLVLHRGDGTYTDAAEQILRHAAPLDIAADH